MPTRTFESGYPWACGLKDAIKLPPLWFPILDMEGVWRLAPQSSQSWFPAEGEAQVRIMRPSHAIYHTVPYPPAADQSVVLHFNPVHRGDIEDRLADPKVHGGSREPSLAPQRLDTTTPWLQFSTSQMPACQNFESLPTYYIHDRSGIPPSIIQSFIGIYTSMSNVQRGFAHNVKFAT
ncbi:hypothetical protein CALCODRAFT_487722 [Calocera cornea HHB12733]|uniref:Uncharacterized protein n=1 Tax=Calocera cornea HHB12733 TaxID=1353952 RepID=A0A165CZ05_9BASI|nr:hypothetical protein CALCODRAFT_487722 [Calocera cornea HHB12733]